MCVELRGRKVAGGPDDGLRRHRAPEHLIDLAHGRPRIRSNGKQRGARLVGPLLARDAQKVPCRVLDIVWIHRSMRLELAATIGIPAGVVQSDAALPELRRLTGRELRDLVERRGRLRDATLLELVHGAVEQRLWSLGTEHGAREPRDDEPRNRTHDPGTSNPEPCHRRSTAISVLSLRTYKMPSASAGYARTVSGSS